MKTLRAATVVALATCLAFVLSEASAQYYPPGPAYPAGPAYPGGPAYRPAPPPVEDADQPGMYAPAPPGNYAPPPAQPMYPGQQQPYARQQADADPGPRHQLPAAGRLSLDA